MTQDLSNEPKTDETSNEETRNDVTLPKEAIQETRNETKKKLKAKKDSIMILGVIITAVIGLMLYVSFGSFLNRNISNQIQINTITLQNGLDDVVNQINLFEVTNNENHLILLQSQLTKLDVLFEQTEAMSDSFLRFDQTSKASKLHHLIQTNIYYLEACLDGTIQFVPNNLNQFKTELSFIEDKISANPTATFADFINLTNDYAGEYRNLWK